MKNFIYIVLAFIILLSACNEKKETIRKELQEIHFGAIPTMDYIPFVLAKEKGIYDSLGIKVSIIKFSSEFDRDIALQAGTIDGNTIDYTSAIIRQANGDDLYLIMKNDGPFYFITGKNSGIDSLSQLKGKNIAISHNTAVAFATDKALESVNIQMSENNIPEINKSPIRLEMLQNGQIDASIFSDPSATIALSNGHKSLISIKDLGISLTGTAFSGKALAEKSEEIKLLIQGYNLAVDYISTHPLSDWSAVLTENTELPEALINQITLPNYQHAKRPATKEIRATTEWLKIKHLISWNYKESQLVDTTFVGK